VGPALAALRAGLESLPGVGPKRAAELDRYGLRSVEDVLYHLPFRYEDRRALRALSSLHPGEEATAVGEVGGVHEGRAGRRGRRVLEVVLRDAEGILLLVWFNQIPYFSRRFRPGQRLIVHGKVEPPLGGGPRRMIHPEIETLAADEEPAALARIVPVYEKPTEMHVGTMRRIVQAAVAEYADRVPSALPAAVAARQRLLDPARALRHLHCPAPEADLEGLGAARSLAHRALVFDELFFLQLGLALRRSAGGREPGTAFPGSSRLVPALRTRLPFRPTAAQERAFAEIATDLGAPHPMRRLLQGDVGSGKTLVALLAALVVVDAGFQAALMAPTELLAEQHAETVRPLLAALGLEAVLLTGAVKGRARRDALAGLAEGRTALAVGTHALIQDQVRFARLGLAIVDEQHRFGVLQRAALQRQGGDAVDVLVMSATPIPRTLALTLYGDLAVSTLDELPPGRTPIATELCRESRRERVYRRIRDEVAAGHQAYVVYPLVEESEKTALRAATTMAQQLAAGPLAGLRLGLVHGRMKAEAKDEVMRRFKAGAFDVLVSTTVIEVGIDVPNATVIVIEHAERFGLSQLHQLRGRVGRGRAPGHCLLVVPDWTGEEAYHRLSTLERSTDGFHIAEADLAIRGPGDFLGTRQAGLPPFRVANLVRDTALMRAARDEALAWLEADPDLSRPESERVRAVLAHRWEGRLGLARVG
jgi:ATP-dependent DNA helicase RecG